MDAVMPWVGLVLVSWACAYHRWRLAAWSGLSLTVLLVAWLAGASAVSTLIAAGVVAVISLLGLIPAVQRAWITSPLMGMYRN